MTNQKPKVIPYTTLGAIRNDEELEAYVQVRIEERLACQSAAAPPMSDLSDTAIIDLAMQWGAFEPSRFDTGIPQFHTGQPGIIGFARAILAASSDEDRKLMEQAHDALLGTDPIDPNSAESKAIAALRSRLDGEKK